MAICLPTLLRVRRRRKHLGSPPRPYRRPAPSCCAARSHDRAGQPFAGPLTRAIRDGGGLTEGPLQGTEAIAQGSSVLGAEVWRRGGHQAGEGVDEDAGLSQVKVSLRVGTLAEPTSDRGGGHQMDGQSGHDLDRGDLGQVAYGVIGGYVRGVGHHVSLPPIRLSPSKRLPFRGETPYRSNRTEGESAGGGGVPEGWYPFLDRLPRAAREVELGSHLPPPGVRSR